MTPDLHVLLAWANAHPALAMAGAYVVLSAIASAVRSKAAPGSKLAHGADVCLSLLGDAWKLLNALRGLAGKDQLPTPVKASEAVTPPSGLPKAGIALVVAAGALLWASPAQAQVVEGPPGCLGLAKVHCGGAVGLMSYRPAAGAFDFTPAVGPSIDYHFQKWLLGLALLNGGYQALLPSGKSGWFGSLAPFAALGDSWGLARGLAIAPQFDVYGSDGGLLKNWTWKNNFRIGFAGSADLLAGLQKL